jgi:hypothetical protein
MIPERAAYPKRASQRSARAGSMRFASAALATAAVLWAGTAMAAPNARQRPREWLEVRRGGIEGLLQVATDTEGMRPRALRYALDVPASHPLAGTTLELRRRALPAARGQAGSMARRQGQSGRAGSAGRVGTELVVEVRDAKGRLLAGLASDASGMWTSHGGKASATDAGLFRAVDRLGFPLALFAALELAPRYEAKVEGEFSGTAIVRMQPGYTEGATLEPLKLGISKRFLCMTVTEVDDAKGKLKARLLWLDTRLVDSRVVADRLRVRLADRKDPLEWRLLEERLDKDAGRRWGRKAL